MTFRTRLFLASLLTAGVTLAVATALVSWSVRRNLEEGIQRGLVAQARLAAGTLAHQGPASAVELDAEADALGRLAGVRVTFISPGGQVLGDSNVTAAGLGALENHADRPEVRQAVRDGLGLARRHSRTINTDMLYVAVPVRSAEVPELAVVRLALPLTGIREQLADVRRSALIALSSGLTAALFLSWAGSALVSRRVRTIAAAAERYAAGDLSRPPGGYGSDELATVAGVLEEAIREIGRRAAEGAADTARMEAILGGMVEGVLVVDAQGYLELVNAAARRMLGLGGPVNGRHYLEIVRHPGVARQIGAALDGAAAPELEITLPRDPGATLLARSAPMRAPGAAGAVLVLHDITALRRTDRIRRDFVANVSHELRTPLTAVRGYVEALLDDSVGPGDARTFLETIDRHTLRMERLVRDLLRLARLDAGQEPLQRTTCDVEALFAGVVAELSGLIDGRRQQVVTSIAADAATVPGDPARLHDALRNLLENATNYAPEGSAIRLASVRAGERIVLTVADAGPGIPEEDLPRVFERFYRVDKARARGTRDPGGTGLGLAIARHLVEVHGGRITAANGAAGGAVFTVELPAPNA